MIIFVSSDIIIGYYVQLEFYWQLLRVEYDSKNLQSKKRRKIIHSASMFSAMVDGIPPTAGVLLLSPLFRRFLAKAELELMGFLTVKLVSVSTRISLRATDISCCISGH